MIKNHNKGRSQERIAYRNQKLAARFYFYSNILGLKYDHLIQYLEKEFDLTEPRLYDLISEISQDIVNLENNRVTVKQLKKVYPFMSWQYSHSKTSQILAALPLTLF